MARIILVADDSPTIQKRALAILKNEGFEVETVSNGVAAIKRLAVLHPVVILADVSMPGRDGYEVCDFVKKSPELSGVPVLLIASDMEPYHDSRGAQVKADGVIKKPFEARELVALVAKFTGALEAETIRAPQFPISPPPPGERTQEFLAFSEVLGDRPTVIHPTKPDFSSHPDGFAFTEPSVEEVQEPSPESSQYRPGLPFPPRPDAPPAFAELAFEPASGLDEIQFATAAAESTTNSSAQPSAPSAFDLSPSAEQEFATQEPVFIDEHPMPPPHHHAESGARTMIFRTPLAIADPEWKDETVPAAPVFESTGPTGLEPQLGAQAPIASAETRAQQVSEPTIPAVTATSLDSFSLDDAAAGQVHFPSLDVDMLPLEHMHFTPADDASALDLALLEDFPQSPGTRSFAPDPAAMPISVEPARSQATSDLVHAKSSSPETTPKPIHTPVDQPAARQATVYAQSVPCDSVPEWVSAEASSEKTAPSAAAPTAELKPSWHEGTPEGTVPPATFDWNLFYLVVHKTVAKMSPPIFPADLIEGIARRIADEIAIEITSGSPHSQA